MSVLLAFVSAIAAKLAPPDVEVTQLKAEINALKREFEEARLEAERWRILADSWRRRYETETARQQVTQLLNYEYCNCTPARHDALIGAYRLNRFGAAE